MPALLTATAFILFTGCSDRSNDRDAASTGSQDLAVTAAAPPEAIRLVLTPMEVASAPVAQALGKPESRLLHGAPRNVMPDGRSPFDWESRVLAMDVAPPFDTAASGRASLLSWPQPIAGQPMRFKDNTSGDLRYASTDEGLASPFVYDAIRDSRGFLYLATYAGISRYDGREFVHFTEANGLPVPDVKCIMQDSRGHLWLGTQGGGACRYDGQSLLCFSEQDGLGSNALRTIVEDSGGRIWFGTLGGGAACWDGQRLTRLTTESGLSGNRVWTILQSRDGSLWFGTVDGGITRYDGRSFLHITEKNGLSSNKVRALLEDDEGFIWAGTHGGGLNRIGPDGIFSYARDLDAPIITSLYQDGEKTIYAGTQGNGLLRLRKAYSHASSALVAVTRITEEDGLSDNRVSAIVPDPVDGSLWLCTEGGGFNRLAPASFRHLSASNGLPSNYVHSILQSDDGALWLGTADAGLCRVSGDSVQVLGQRNGLPASGIWALGTGADGSLWLGTYGSGAYRIEGQRITAFSEKHGLPGTYVVALLRDSKGRMWLGCDGGGVAMYDGSRFHRLSEQEGLSSNKVRSLAEDREGRIWIGTNGGGACCLDGDSLRCYTEENGLAHNSVLSLLSAEDGKLWLGTGSGISLWEDGAFRTWGVADGLSGPLVWSLTRDKSGAVWAGTGDGLSRIPQGFPNSGSITRFGKERGLRSLTFSPGTALCDSQGRLWWGTQACLSYLTSSQEAASPSSGILTVDRVVVGQQPFSFNPSGSTDTAAMPWQGVAYARTEAFANVPVALQMPSAVRQLTAHLSMPDPSGISRPRFRFKLSPQDKDWWPESDDPRAVFSSLPPGRHALLASATADGHTWTEPVEFRFTIHPPWWSTWWAYLIWIAVAAAVVFGIFSWRTHALLQRQRELEQTVSERTSDLRQRSEELLVEKDRAERKGREVMQSIAYARRLQEAVLTPPEVLQELFPGSFLLYLPRDIVSGDFYWATEADGSRFVAVADCTGHGVPGAMLSVIGLNGLHRAVSEMGLRQPKDILHQLNHSIEEVFEGSRTKVRDGMDIAVCAFSPDGRSIAFAGANLSLWVVRDGDITVLEANRRPIGYYENQKPFEQQELALRPGDFLFLFTDGYHDQQGGDRGKRIMRGQFKELVIEVAGLPPARQQPHLMRFFGKWKGSFEQTDDVCVVGIRV